MLREDSEFAARSRSLQPQLGSSPAARGCPARGLRAISFQPNSAVPLAPSRSVPYPYPSPCPSRPRPAAYQRVDVGAGPQAVGAGRAVPPAVRPRPRQQAGAERQQRAAEPQQQRHGAARRRGQTAAAAPRHPPPPPRGWKKLSRRCFNRVPRATLATALRAGARARTRRPTAAVQESARPKPRTAPPAQPEPRLPPQPGAAPPAGHSHSAPLGTRGGRWAAPRCWSLGVEPRVFGAGLSSQRLRSNSRGGGGTDGPRLLPAEPSRTEPSGAGAMCEERALYN